MPPKKDAGLLDERLKTVQVDECFEGMLPSLEVPL